MSTLPKKINVRTILHLDMDAFFAAVEQLDHPQYRGKPVIVGSDPKGGSGRGVVATASYEARKYGIHSAMPISQAYRRCPHGIYVRGRHKRYSQLSQAMTDILIQFTPMVQKISIDEAFLDVTASMNLFGGALELARRLRETIRSELQLTASVGVAPNKFLAKIASDLRKPDGLVVVQPGQEREFLQGLPISALWGVGKKTEEILTRMGLMKIGDLAQLSEIELTQRFGKYGSSLWRLARGMDDRPVMTGGTRKSISQELTFDADVDDVELIEKTLFRLADSVARTLRKQKIKGRTVIFKIRFEDFTTFTRSKTFAEFIDSTQLIKGVAISMYRRFHRNGKRVRLVGIGISQLTTASGEQLGLFDQEEQMNSKLTRLLDSLKEKFGDQAVQRASLLDPRKRDTGIS